MKTKPTLIAASLLLASATAFAQTQGVSKTEITLGSIQDLSGPLAGNAKRKAISALRLPAVTA